VYKKTSLQPSFPNFLLPFEGELKTNNPWIVMADLIPWDELEAQYAEQFHASLGAPVKEPAPGSGSIIGEGKSSVQ